MENTPCIAVITLEGRGDFAYASKQVFLAAQHRHREIVLSATKEANTKYLKALGSTHVLSFANPSAALTGCMEIRNQIEIYNASQTDVDKQIRSKMVLIGGMAGSVSTWIRSAVDLEDAIQFGDLCVSEFFAQTAQQMNFVCRPLRGPSAESYFVIGDKTDASASPSLADLGMSRSAAEIFVPGAGEDDVEPEFGHDVSEEPEKPKPPTEPSMPPIIFEEQSIELAEDKQPVKKPPKSQATPVVYKPVIQRRAKQSNGWRFAFYGMLIAVLIPVGVLVVGDRLGKKDDKPPAAEKLKSTSVVLQALNEEPSPEVRPRKVEKQGFGELVIRSTPRVARIKINGKVVGKRTPLRLKKVPYGIYNLTVQRPGFNEHREMFNLDNHEKRIDVTLSKR